VKLVYDNPSGRPQIPPTGGIDISPALSKMFRKPILNHRRDIRKWYQKISQNKREVLTEKF
jgi:hypothetical protein